jgi:hypothetical protein
MSDDDKKMSSETAFPFVQNTDFSHVAVAAAHAQRQRWYQNASLYMNNQTPLPLVVLSGKVRYVDFGFTSAREYWTEVAEPSYERFINDESRASAILAFMALAPLLDWL